MYDLFIVIFILLFTIVLLASNKIQTDVVLLFAVSVLVVLGILEPVEALQGFTNPGLAIIAVLYVVAAGLRTTGAVSWLSQMLLGNPDKLQFAQIRLLAAAMFLSAFVNNSPVVAVFTASVQNWAKRTRFQVSQLLMPLSYAAILGGTCTLIGTSTNLVVDGLLQQNGLPGFHLFDLAYVGIPACLVGFVYLILFSRKLLPDRQSSEGKFENTREYMVEMRVEPGCELANKTIEDAGLRHLPGLFLVEVIRKSQVFPVVSPTTRILEGDLLVFVGAVESVVELRSIRGLVEASDQSFKVHGHKRERRLFEAVVSADNPVVSNSIRESRFRHRYNAAVLAVARDGKRIKGKVGDITLKPGDILLLEAQKGFMFKYQYSRDFLLIKRLENTRNVDHKKAPLALLIITVMVVLNITGIFSIFSAALLAAGAMLVFGCLSIEDARKSIDYKLLLTIAMAFGLGVAIQKAGLADLIADQSIEVSDSNPMILLIMIYLATLLLTEIITNNAAAIVMFPVAMSASNALDISIVPLSVAVMIAASASFITPIGYQTNLMVQGPGGYRYTDYVKLGLPMSLLVSSTVIVIIPLIWPF